MPDDENKLDDKTLSEAVNFAQEHYAIHKRLPTHEEFARKFPSANITPELISEQLDVSKIKTTSAEASNESIEGKKGEEESEDEKKYKRNKYLDSSGQSSFKDDLKTRVKGILQQSGAKNLDSAKLDKVAAEVSEASIDKLVNQLPEVQDISQVNRLVADNVTQAILSHPELDNTRIKVQKVFEKAVQNTGNLATVHQQTIETTAVLKSADQIRSLKKPNEQTKAVIGTTVDEYLQAKAPMTPPATGQQIKAELNGFVASYAANFDVAVSGLISSGKTPGFQKLKEIKSSAFNSALNSYKDGLHQKYKVDPTQLASRLSGNLGLAPLSLEQVELMGLGGSTPKAFTFSRAAGDFASKGAGFALNAKQGKFENYLSLLTADSEKFNSEYMKALSSVEAFRGKKTLTLSQRTEYFKAQKYLQLLATAKRFETTSKSKAIAYRRMWNAVSPRETSRGTGLTFATQTTWDTTQAIIQNRFGAASQNVLAQSNYMHILAERAHGAMAFSFSDFIPDAPKFGMGIPSIGSNRIMVANVGARIMRKIATGIAGLTGALALYFLGLGKAAFTGFMIGATVGGTIGVGLGATIGLQIALASGPFAPIVGLVTVPTGAFLGGATGAFVGGVAGGLIAAGLYAGSATMVSMGVGAGIGGAIGAYAGFAVGTTAATLVILGCAAVTGGACAFLLPLIPVSGAIGGAIGAVVGTIVGAAAGYVIGKYIISPAQSIASNLWDGFVSGVNSAGGLISSAFSSLGSIGTLGGLAGTIASGFMSIATTLGGGLLGGLGTAAGFLTGGLGGFSISGLAVSIPVLGAVAVVPVATIIIGTTVATSFFNAEGQPLGGTPGENKYVSISKLASVTGQPPAVSISFPNPPPTKTVKFDLHATAKENLTSITCTDNAKLNKENSNESIPTPNIPCPETLPKDQLFDFSFTINATSPQFNDALLVNTFTLSGTSENGTSFSVSANATVAIGNAPVSDPQGWPTCGQITQGPYDDSGTHNGSFASAIDINNNPGTNVYATHSGTIIHAGLDDFLNDGDIYVAIQGDSYITYYVHLLSVDPTIHQGDLVQAGRLIGKMDATGSTHGVSHLHYMIYDLSHSPVSESVFNSLVPPYEQWNEVESSWGPC